MKEKISRYASLGLSLLMGAVCGVIIAKALQAESGRPLPQLLFIVCLFILLLYVAAIFQLIIHEAGHLVFGLLTGYRFCSFRVFSFMLLKTEDGMKCKRLSLAGTGGQCLMIPPPWSDGDVPVIGYNLGGAAVNLAVGLIFLAAAIACKGSPLFSASLLIFAVTGLITAVMNGIPMHSVVDNDGYNAFSLRKDRKAMRAFWIQMKINQLTSEGKRLKDMPAELFAVPKEAEMKSSLVATLGVFAGNRLMDGHDFDGAKTLYENLLGAKDACIAGLYKNLIACDLAYIELVGANDPKAIERIFTKAQRKFMKAMRTFPAVIRTEYAYALLAEKDAQKAQKFKEAFAKCAKTYPYAGDIASERELMVIAEAACAAKAT